MKIISLIVLIAFTISSISSFWSPLWSQQKEKNKLTLGVIPFKAEGIQEHNARILSTRLHSELIKTNRFHVVETERIEEILNELGFQQSGLCSKTECIVQVGNLSGARLMVTGTVGKMGKFFTLDVRIIDVKNRQGIWAKTAKSEKIDDLLGLMSDIAWKLAYPNSQRPSAAQEKSSKTWLWLLGSAVIIGGGVTALMLMKNTNEPGIIDPIGSPPDPPAN